jgi:hypothetical protein
LTARAVDLQSASINQNGREDFQGQALYRQTLVVGAATLGPAIIVRPTRAAECKFVAASQSGGFGKPHKNVTAM